MQNQIIAYHDGELSDPKREAFSRHLESCAACRQALEALERSESRLIFACPEIPQLSADAQAALFQRALAEAAIPQRKTIRRAPVLTLCGAALVVLMAWMQYSHLLFSHPKRTEIARIPTVSDPVDIKPAQNKTVPILHSTKVRNKPAIATDRIRIARLSGRHRFRLPRKRHERNLQIANVLPQKPATSVLPKSSHRPDERPAGSLLVVLNENQEPTPEPPTLKITVEESSDKTPGIAQVASYRPDPAGIGGTWTQYVVTRDSKGVVSLSTSETSLKPDMRSSVLSLQIAQLADSTQKGFQQ